MDIHQCSPTLSNDFDRRKSDAGLPPYHQSPRTPLLLAQMGTTRTEVVTTTAPETTLFSFPHWTRKRTGAQAPIPQRPSVVIDNATSPEPHPIHRQPPPGTLFDKALPPTPPDEIQDTSYATDVIPDVPKSAAFPQSASLPLSFLTRSRKHSTGPQSTTALAHAALGIGLPHASTSFSRETNTVTFISQSPPSSPTVAPPFNVRRVKSSQRVLPRHTSDTHDNTINQEHLVERRRRGLSFSAASFLTIVNPDVKGKGNEPLSANESHASPKLISRKSSFWSKKKASPSHETPASPTLESTTLALPTLPPVHHYSPFEISEFTVSLPPDESFDLPRAQAWTSYSEKLGTHSSLPSLNLSEGPISHSDQSDQSEASSSGRISESHLRGGTLPQSRPRSQTSTPLLYRLSMGVFSSGESSPAPSIRSNAHSQPLSTASSPHPHTPKQESHVPKPLGMTESAEMYVARLKSIVSKADVAGVLASSSDSFYAQALRVYISQFQFLDVPIDVALRKLLMEVGLPRETQQIDRVMEAFASRYMQSNPNIFVSEDHPYILAFSLIMLHTDAFNPSNKRKMTKADYIKNTKLPGIPVEVLECLFDNIVFAPFIYIEDPVEFTGQLGLTTEATRPMAVNNPTSGLSSATALAPFKIGNKVDPYYLIINNLLDPLRVDVNSSIPLENPFTYEGTNGPWDEQELHRSFMEASIIDINLPPVQRSTTIFSLNTTTTPSTPVDHEPHLATAKTETWSLKITKLGLLNRKDDLLEGAKKSSNRKWRSWSVILTGSQLLLFRDPTWIAALSQPVDNIGEKQDISPPANVFRPDESFSLKDAIAVYDRSYAKYNHTMRFVLPDGRQILFQAHDDADLNEWISKINYASAFKTIDIRMRPPGLSGEDVLLTGVAAATSHLHDMQSRCGLRRPRSWDFNAAHDLMDMLSSPTIEKPPLKRRVTMSGRAEFELEAPVAPEAEGTEQFKATFDQVKADLAASSWSSLVDPWLPQDEHDHEEVFISSSPSASSSHSSSVGLPSRSQIIQVKVRDLDSKIQTFQSQLDSDMVFVRNIAILTPFQKSTRSRLSAAVQGVAKRIGLTRLNLEKLKCYCHVLRCDLASEGRTWHQSKRVALRAAKETLHSRRGCNVHPMALPLLDSKIQFFPGHFSPVIDTPSSQQHGSSASDSFHSAKDFGPEWPSSEDLNTTSPETTFPQSQGTLSSFSTLSSRKSDDVPRRPTSSSLISQRPHSHPDTISSSEDQEDTQHHDDEQAEEWNRTRCAQRVSLIHVPSVIGLSTKLRNAVERS